MTDASALIGVIARLQLMEIFLIDLDNLLVVTTRNVHLFIYLFIVFIGQGVQPMSNIKLRENKI